MITPKAVLMVKPWDFSYSEESAKSNAFQKNLSGLGDVSQIAIKEYEQAIEKIKNL